MVEKIDKNSERKETTREEWWKVAEVSANIAAYVPPKFSTATKIYTLAYELKEGSEGKIEITKSQRQEGSRPHATISIHEDMVPVIRDALIEMAAEKFGPVVPEGWSNVQSLAEKLKLNPKATQEAVDQYLRTGVDTGENYRDYRPKLTVKELEPHMSPEFVEQLKAMLIQDEVPIDFVSINDLAESLGRDVEETERQIERLRDSGVIRGPDIKRLKIGGKKVLYVHERVRDRLSGISI